MLHAHYCFLQLTIYNHSVGHDDNIIENDLVVGIVERSKTIRKPSDSVGLAGACTVLNKIVERGAVFLYIGKELADGIELMITGKYNALLDFDLACLFILFFRGLNENEFGDQVENGIFGENIVPHIMNWIIVLTGSISCTCIDTLAVALIERQEEGLFAVELRCHIDFVQVHSEIDKCASLEQEQSGLRITLHTVLIYRIVRGLSCIVAFQLHRDNCKAVEEDNNINSLFIIRPHFFHDGKAVHLVFPHQVFIESCGRLCEHQLQLMPRQLNTVTEDFKQAAPFLRTLRIDERNNGIFEPVLMYLAEFVHCLRLGIVQKAEQHFTVKGKTAVKVGRFSYSVAVLVTEYAEQF